MRLLILLSLISFNTFAQNDSIRFKPKSNIEFFVFPGLIYNHASLGYTLKTSDRVEHNIEINNTLTFAPWFRYSLRTYYSKNFSSKKYKSRYTSLWLGLANTLQSTEGEADTYQKFLYKIGIGKGHKILNNQKERFKIEYGVGLALNTIDKDFKLLQIDKYGINNNLPVIPVFRLNLKYIIPLYRK